MRPGGFARRLGSFVCFFARVIVCLFGCLRVQSVAVQSPSACGCAAPTDGTLCCKTGGLCCKTGGLCCNTGGRCSMSPERCEGAAVVDHVRKRHDRRIVIFCFRLRTYNARRTRKHGRASATLLLAWMAQAHAGNGRSHRTMRPRTHGRTRCPRAARDLLWGLWDVFLFSSHSDADTMRTFDRFDSAQAASVATALMGD